VSDALIHRRLEASARAEPTRDAVVLGERSLTYAELDANANRLARLLAAEGVRPGDRVALLIEKSPETVAAIYGILKAGGTYVPLDEQAPAARLAYIMRDAGVRLVVSSAARARDWVVLREAGATFDTVVVADGPVDGQLPDVRVVDWAELAKHDDAPVDVDVSSDDLAYVLYTSGSTGEPKGVMLSHRNCLAFVEWAADLVGVRPEDRVSSHAPFHFDLSTFDLFGAAVGGATVVLVPREQSVFPVELAGFIRDARITIWYSVPSILTLLTLRGGIGSPPPEALRTILFAGEVFPTKYLAQLMDLLPDVSFYNWFGPTETNVCTWYEVPRPASALPDDLPIGKAIGGVTAIVADVDGKEVPHGDTGELLIQGPTVMHGYLGKPEQTERVLDTSGAERLYRTGDLVAYDDEGNLRFLGRRDAQIKSRGYRIELGEIERAIYSHEGVTECAVVPVPDDVVTNRIKAYVVAHGLTDSELTGFCRSRLPRYMVPDEIEFRDALPKSSTGKIDRRKLTTT
jgi:amino acid adenylation domain-containing protein